MRNVFTVAIFACHRLCFYSLSGRPATGSHYKQPSMIFLLNATFHLIHSLAWQSAEIAQCHQFNVISACT